MIKIINSPKKTNEIYKETCECGCQFECEKSDMYEGTYGLYYVACPICDNRIYVEEIEPVELNEHNLKFPDHFYHFGEMGVDISDERIQEWIKENIRNIKQSEGFSFIGSGDTKVIVLDMNGDGEYEIIVAKDYWAASIPK